jgi:transketolase
MSKKEMVNPRKAYGEALIELGRKYKNLVVLDADLSKSTKTIMFAKKYPERFFEMGIAEANMMSCAAGFASCGKIPFASTFAVFATGRVYDQVRMDIAYSNANVKIFATHGGISVGKDGVSHQMLEDFALMRVLPNMTVMAPSDATQTKKIVHLMAEEYGPMYARVGRANAPLIYSNKQVEDLNMDTNAIITAEEHSIIGGLGAAVAETLMDNNICIKFFRMGIKDIFCESGSPADLLKKYELNEKYMVKKAQNLLKK